MTFLSSTVAIIILIYSYYSLLAFADDAGLSCPVLHRPTVPHRQTLLLFIHNLYSQKQKWPREILALFVGKYTKKNPWNEGFSAASYRLIPREATIMLGKLAQEEVESILRGLLADDSTNVTFVRDGHHVRSVTNVTIHGLTITVCQFFLIQMEFPEQTIWYKNNNQTDETKVLTKIISECQPTKSGDLSLRRLYWGLIYVLFITICCKNQQKT